MSKYFSISENVMLNEVENQGVIFYEDENLEEKIYYLNDTSLAVILYLETGKKSADDIANHIYKHFSVDFEECKKDVEDLLETMEKYNLILAV